ncbi:MAG: hypothetical protein HKL86_06360 [Acidimicrobiaceae bacterium]|nr:hypothetical protein [Acidimicrobiaceae bacterium]
MAILERLSYIENRTLIFPYFAEEQIRLISDYFGSECQIFHIGRNGTFELSNGVNIGAHHSRIRRTLHLDEVDFFRFGLVGEEVAWSEVADWASQLIATHSLTKGARDHSSLVELRIRKWMECEDVEVLPLVVKGPHVRGIVITLIWEDWMEVHEIGMSGEMSELRRAVYAMLVYHLPIKSANARGLRHVRVGLGAELPKRVRGATMSDMFGAVALCK